MLLFFSCQRLQYWDREYTMTNIVLFSTNQIADILYVSDKWTYAECLLHLLQNIFLYYIYYFKVLPQNIIRYTNIRNT